MSTIYYVGKATAVAQVTTVQITAYDAATTYKLTVGGVVISAAGVTDATATAAALAAAWNASTHPYCTGVTAANNSSDTVTLTADTAGVPFTVTSSKSGGTGTIGAATTGTASAGPNHADTPGNYSGGALPGAGDTLILRDCNVDILWGLETITDALAKIVREDSFTGRIGLPYDAYTASAATDPDTTAVEYRPTHWKIKTAILELGGRTGPVTGSHPVREKWDLTTTTCAITVFGTAGSSDDADKAPCRLLCNSASTTLTIYDGSVSIGRDKPGDTATLGTINQFGAASRIDVGDGVTLTTFDGQQGSAALYIAATTIRSESGHSIELCGTGAIGTLELRGATSLRGASYTVSTALKG